MIRRSRFAQLVFALFVTAMLTLGSSAPAFSAVADVASTPMLASTPKPGKSKPVIKQPSTKQTVRPPVSAVDRVPAQRSTSKPSIARPGSTSNRNVAPPANSTGKVAKVATSKKVIKNPPTAKISVPPGTRVKGGSYTNGGHTWKYDKQSYQEFNTQYRGGYPDRFTNPQAYWTLYDSPYYLPNYALIGNPWYGLAYPTGFAVSNGMLVQTGFHPGAGLKVLGIILLLIILAIIVAVVLSRRGGNSSYDDEPRTYGRI